jgi:hypothetical protein
MARPVAAPRGDRRCARSGLRAPFHRDRAHLLAASAPLVDLVRMPHVVVSATFYVIDGATPTLFAVAHAVLVLCHVVTLAARSRAHGVWLQTCPGTDSWNRLVGCAAW